MYTQQSPIRHNRVLITTLLTFSWLILQIGWIVMAWGQYSWWQIVAVLGMSFFAYAALCAMLWIEEKGHALAGTILVTCGWLMVSLYWIAFVWSQHHWLFNLAILFFSMLVSLQVIVVLLTRRTS